MKPTVQYNAIYITPLIYLMLSIAFNCNFKSSGLHLFDCLHSYNSVEEWMNSISCKPLNSDGGLASFIIHSRRTKHRLFGFLFWCPNSVWKKRFFLKLVHLHTIFSDFFSAKNINASEKWCLKKHSPSLVLTLKFFSWVVTELH